LKSNNEMYFGYATGICSHLKSILSYKFLFFDTIVSYILLLHRQGCKDPRLYFEAKRGQRANIYGEQ